MKTGIAAIAPGVLAVTGLAAPAFADCVAMAFRESIEVQACLCPPR